MHKTDGIIYVLHKKGENSHYKGLVALAKQRGLEVKFREFSIIGKSFKAIFKLDAKLYGKQWVNLFFLLSLLFSKHKKVVLGIAPYDYKLLSVLFFLKGHQIYYHTSWTCWDGTYYPKTKFVTPKVKNRWKVFLEKEVSHIFAVSEKTKQELSIYYAIETSKISVVCHTVDDEFFTDMNMGRFPDSFIYAGRLLPEKGLDELLAFFAEHPEFQFSIAGRGAMEDEVKKYADAYPNINYLGFVADKMKLASIYQQHQYLLMNSVKSKTWEELFGMSIIEAMACKAVPVVTNHSGPKEIITHGKDGYLVNEGDMIPFLENKLKDIVWETVSNHAFKTAYSYTPVEIAKRWAPLLT